MSPGFLEQGHVLNALATRVPTLIIDLTIGGVAFKFLLWDLTTHFFWALVVDGVTSFATEANGVAELVLDKELDTFLEQGGVVSFTRSSVDDVD